MKRTWLGSSRPSRRLARVVYGTFLPADDRSHPSTPKGQNPTIDAGGEFYPPTPSHTSFFNQRLVEPNRTSDSPPWINSGKPHLHIRGGNRLSRSPHGVKANDLAHTLPAHFRETRLVGSVARHFEKKREHSMPLVSPGPSSNCTGGRVLGCLATVESALGSPRSRVHKAVRLRASVFTTQARKRQ